MDITKKPSSKLNNSNDSKKPDATTKPAATLRYPQAPPLGAGYSSYKGTAGKSIAEKVNQANQRPKPKPSREQIGDSNVAAASPEKKKMDPETLVLLCQKGALDVKGSEAENAKASNKFLSNIYRLNRQAALSPDAKKAQDRVIRNAGIKMSKNTDEFTALLKSFLGKKCPRSTVSRCSNALQYARAKKVAPHEFVDFVRDEGGTAECARKMANERKATAGTSEDAEAEAAKLIRERLLGAPKVKVPKEIIALGKGLFSMLLKVEPDGICPVFGYKPAPAGAVRTFRRLKAKSVSPTATKRS